MKTQQKIKTSPAPARQKRRPVKKRSPAQELPEIIYEPARPLTRRRLLIQLATAAAVVLALVFGLSIFFKVDVITVSGAEKYSAWTVTEASGISKGDSLLSFGKAAACGRIQTQLPYVKNVRVGIKLPGTVNIEIEESTMTYAIEEEDGTYWLMTAEGKIVEQIPRNTEQKLTRIGGVLLASPVGEQAVAAVGEELDKLPEGDALAGLAAKRLDTLLEVLKNLEKNEILGQVDSIDVSNPEDLTLSYEGRYQVRLGNAEQLEKKIRSMHQAIEQMSRYQTGSLDISFTTWPDEVAFTPAEKS